MNADVARLTRILGAAGVSPDRVSGHRQLDGGTFNTVYLSRLVDGTGLVLKVPDPREPVLKYEEGILATEAMYYRLAARCAGVSVPSLVHLDTGDEIVPGGFLVMSECPGTSLFTDIHDDHAFLQGYRSAGGSLTFDNAALLRLSLYRAYLYLLMWVETAPRRYDEKQRARLRSLAFHPLAEILNTWSARA
jgi:hypothetical protein